MRPSDDRVLRFWAFRIEGRVVDTLGWSGSLFLPTVAQCPSLARTRLRVPTFWSTFEFVISLTLFSGAQVLKPELSLLFSLGSYQNPSSRRPRLSEKGSRISGGRSLSGCCPRPPPTVLHPRTPGGIYTEG